MTARRPETPEARPTDGQILQEIEAALREWAKFYGAGVDPALQRSEGARATAQTAMTLMVHNLRLLKWCRDNCSWNPEMNMVFTCLGKAEIDWGTMKHGDFRGWAGYFVGPLAFPDRRSFLDQVIRWADELERMEKEAGGPTAMDEPLSRPMSKSNMMKALGIDGQKRFATWAKGKLKQVGDNRQLWQVRLNACAPNERAKLEKA